MKGTRIYKVFPLKNLSLKAHKSKEPSQILKLTSRTPIVAYPTSTVKQACKTMVDHGIRRLPVVNPGTNKLVGIISARDLVDFFGGGEKYKIIKNNFNGNIFAAVNLPIAKIMTENVVFARETDSIDKVAHMMLEKGVGGCPIVDNEGKVLGVVSERDFIKGAAGKRAGRRVQDIMSKEVISISPSTSIGNAAKVIIGKGVRRLPVIQNGGLMGVLRTTSILRFISDNDFAKFGTADADEVLAKEKVEDAMSGYFITVRPEEEIEDVVDLIIARRLGGFPVEKNRKIVGIVTEHDIFRALYA